MRKIYLASLAHHVIKTNGHVGKPITNSVDFSIIVRYNTQLERINYLLSLRYDIFYGQ